MKNTPHYIFCTSLLYPENVFITIFYEKIKKVQRTSQPSALKTDIEH